MKLDLEHHKSLRIQQMEAYKLIQVSLDKLNTTAVLSPVPGATSAQRGGAAARHVDASNNRILVYKEVDLHKNLLVSKILNKAK